MNEYLEFAVSVANKAGEIMLQYFQVGVENQIKTDEGNTPVTAADRSINQLLIDEVYKKYPHHSVIGEEASNLINSAEWKWVCDPIDGTIPYVIGMPTNVFSLSLVNKDGMPVVSVVHDPYMKRIYTAIKGQGAFLNNKPIRVNSISEIKETIVGISGMRTSIIKPVEFKTAVISACFRPLMLNCLMYEAMLVATGQIAACSFMGNGAYDAVSAKLIVEEAGGKVTSIFGEEQRYDQLIQGVIVSNGLIHEDLVNFAKASRL